MSNTFHHSLRWGRDHRFAKRPDRGYGFSNRGIGDAPGWHVRMHDHRPGRKADRLLLKKIALEIVDADDASFTRTGGRKPHRYFW